MPSTAQNVTEIQRAVSNYSRAQILSKLSEAVRIVYSENVAQALKVDSSGQPPVLATTAGDYTYDLPADCRELFAVVHDMDTFFADYSDHGTTLAGYSKDIIFNNRLYKRIPATSVSATYGEVATVTFTDDPGDTTDYYRLIYYKLPSELLTESDQIPLPEEVHYLVRKMVLAMLNTENYGETGFDDQVIDDTARRIRNKLNKGTQARVGKTGVRVQDIAPYSVIGYGYGRRSR